MTKCKGRKYLFSALYIDHGYTTFVHTCILEFLITLSFQRGQLWAAFRMCYSWWNVSNWKSVICFSDLIDYWSRFSSADFIKVSMWRGVLIYWNETACSRPKPCEIYIYTPSALNLRSWTLGSSFLSISFFASLPSVPSFASLSSVPSLHCLTALLAHSSAFFPKPFSGLLKIRMSLPVQCLNCHSGLVVKASTSRAANLGFDSCLQCEDFSELSYQWLRNWYSSGYPARCLVLQGQRWDWMACVSIRWLSEIDSLIWNFCLSVAAHKIVWADPSLRCTSMLLGC